MADNNIKIIVSGDPSGIVQASRQVTESLGRVRDAVGGPAGALPKLDTAVQKTADTLKTKVPAGANQAAAALTNLGRVAQDAPFGFVGISNNLNPLLESFQRLRAETGSASGALKALGASLLGGGGLGLALSLATAAVTFATAGFGAWTRGLTGSSQATQEAKKEAKELAKALKDVELTRGEATASVEGQITTVTALAAVVSDGNKPYRDRKRALEELKDINKSYFGDLKLEDALTGKLATTVSQYTEALINSAVQKAFADEIANVAKQIAKADNDILKSKNKIAEAQKGVTDSENKLGDAINRRIVNESQSTRIINLTDNLKSAKSKLADTEDELTAKNSTRNQLIEQETLLRKNLNDAVEAGLKFKDLDTKGDQKIEDALKKRLEALEKIKAATKDATQLVGIQEAIFELQVKIAIRDQGKNKLSKAELDQQILGFKNELNDAFTKQAIELEAIPKVRFTQVVLADINQKDISSVIAKAAGFDKKITIPTQFEIDLKLFGKGFADKRQAIRNQFAAVIDSIANGVQEAAVQGAEVVGAAFAGLFSGEGVSSTLAKSAQGLLGIVGGILQQVGKEIIVTSNLVKALKAALKKLFAPGGEAIGIAVGLALVATGALLKNFKFDVPKLAQGGIATSPTLGIFGEAGKEAIIPLDKLPDMIGRLSMNTNSNIALAPTIRISLTDLELGLERVRSSRRRLG